MSISKSWQGVLFYLALKVTLMYAIRAWIRWNLRDMEKRGVVIPKMPSNL